MNILHNIYSVGPGSFGLGPVALNLCREQNALGHRADIWCYDTDEDVRWAEASGNLPHDRILRFPFIGPKALRYSPAMERAAAGPTGEGIDVIHQHCLWLANSRITRFLQNDRRIPSLISPHGSLESWALNRSGWKKRLALAWYERDNLFNATCLQASSEQEIAGIRDFGLKNPIAVIPNGISHAWLDADGNPSAFRSRFNIAPEKRILLYLSRITPVKGLPLLIEALSIVRRQLSDWIVVLAGADEFNHQSEILAAIDRHQLEDHVLFTGMLVDQAKRDAFSAADLFALPTRRENFAIVVVEALGAGVPVITTKGAPWNELLTFNCGWWTDIDTNAIAEALRDALSCPAEQLRQMGQRGKALVEEKYSWTQSARMTIELYEWLLNRRERPDFVVVD